MGAPPWEKEFQRLQHSKKNGFEYHVCAPLLQKFSSATKNILRDCKKNLLLSVPTKSSWLLKSHFSISILTYWSKLLSETLFLVSRFAAPFFKYSWQIHLTKVFLCSSYDSLKYLTLCWPRNQYSRQESWPDDFLGDLAYLRSFTASFF